MARIWTALAIVLILGLLAGMSIDEIAVLLGNGIEGFFRALAEFIEAVSD